jgi:hypothetical protein
MGNFRFSPDDPVRFFEFRLAGWRVALLGGFCVCLWNGKRKKFDYSMRNGMTNPAGETPPRFLGFGIGLQEEPRCAVHAIRVRFELCQ